MVYWQLDSKRAFEKVLGIQCKAKEDKNVEYLVDGE